MIGDILDLPRDLQSRLVATLDLHVRLLALTAGDPEAALQAERLRPDLYYAVTTLVIRLRRFANASMRYLSWPSTCWNGPTSRGDANAVGSVSLRSRYCSRTTGPATCEELARVIDDVHEQAAGDLVETEDLPATIRGHLASAYLPPSVPPRRSRWTSCSPRSNDA